MAVVEDVSSPPVLRSTAGYTTATVVTASFTPPDGSLLVIMADIGYLSAWTTAPTLSCTVTAGGTPTQLYQAADATRKFNAAACWYLPLPTSPGTITCTMTRANALGAASAQLMVRVLTGTTATANLLYGQVLANTTTTTASASVTPLGVGSQIYVSGQTDSISSTITPVATTTAVDNWADSTAGVNLGMGKVTALTADTSAQTVGFSVNGSTTRATIVQVVEVPPAPAGSRAARRVVNRVALIRSSNF